MKLAYDLKFDWFWCMDDDTIPTVTALECMLASPKASEQSTGYLASAVYWKDGALHRTNFPPHLGPYPELFEDLKGGCIKLSSTTFVSMLVTRRAVSDAGFPIKEMFIWFDDIEFTSRISRKYNGYLVLSSSVVHKTAANNPGVDSFSDVTLETLTKYCFGARNKIFFLKTMKMPWVHQALVVAGVIFKMLRPIVFRKTPRVTLTLLVWCLRGIWFNPPIERPA